VAGTRSASRRPTPEAIKPIATGPLSRPVYETAAIRPMLRPACWGSSRAAAVTICGKMPARPSPSRAKPAMAATGVPTSRPPARPNPATRPLPRTSRTGPNRAARRSPATRPAAIVTEKAPSATAAAAADVPRSTCR
jgi:hypothetical protein